MIYIFFHLQLLFSNSQVSFGSIDPIEFESKIIGNRLIEIYRPSNQQISDKTIFIIMHDGQMLFDSSITWNKKDWNIDGIFKQRKNKNNDIIIIGVSSINQSGDGFIDNTKRYAEYFPKESIKYFKKNFKTYFYNKFINQNKFDYLEFLVSELIPFVEKKYNILLDKKNTGIMGGSMGGLISLNAILEYPDTFGFAGCFSVHWIGIKPMDFVLLPIRNKVTKDEDLIVGLIKYVDSKIKNLNDHKIYFDYGTKGLDQYYDKPQSLIDEIFIKNNINFKSLKFEGHDHDEYYFSLRFENALDFLIKNEQNIF
tara:strand:- start:504 stop:1436 length:933 start_codon:yes stop_codon:yes gene_type:complete